MSRSLVQSGRSLAKKVIIFQLVATMLISLLFFINGTHSAISSLLGGSIHLLSYLVFSFFAFLTVNARNPKRIVSQFALGELLKMLVTAFLFILIFKYIDNIKVIPLIIAYIAMIFATLIGSIIFSHNV